MGDSPWICIGRQGCGVKGQVALPSEARSDLMALCEANNGARRGNDR